jgi:similar to stage IV sporulation protein
MILSVIKYAKGYVAVHLTGYAPERFLNLCSNRNILIWNLKPCEDGYRFYISVDGFFSLRPILRKTRTKIRVEKRFGLPFLLFRYRKRKVFAIGFVCFGVILYVMSGYIWNIEVTGNSYLSEEVILDFLKEESAAFGSRISEIDCQELEDMLRSRYDEVIWTSIKIYGTKLTVDVQENLLPEEEYMASEENVIYDIVASADGVITEMITRSGTPLVAVNDTVQKGDILVSGCIEITGDENEVLKRLYHSADADIKAQVQLPYEDILEIEYIEEQHTGAAKERRMLQGFSYTLENPLSRPDYELYEMISETHQLHLTDNFYLPFFYTKQTYYEVTKTVQTHSKEEIRQIATKNLANHIADLEEKGIQIIGKNVMIEKKKDYYVAHGTIETYQSIVSLQPTDMNNTSEEGQVTDGAD